MTATRLALATAAVAALVALGGCDRFTSIDTRVSRANTSFQTGNYQAALIEVRKALKSDPHNLEAQLLLVDVLEASGEIHAALVQLDQAESAGASVQDVGIRKLKLLVSLGDRDQLRKALDEAHDLSRANREAFTGRLLLLENKPAEAQASFDAALAADPTLTDALLGRIEALAAQGKTAEAARAIDELTARDSKAGRAWMLKGALAARAGDYSTAAEALTMAVEPGRGLGQLDLVQAHTQRVESYLAARKLVEARSSLEALQAAAGQSAIVSLMRAKVSLSTGDATTAVNELRKFTQAVPQHMTGRLLLVAALLEQGSGEQAFAEAVRCVSEFPDRDEPRLALAQIELRMGRSSNAEETLKPLTSRSPANPLAVAMAAEIRIRRGEAVAGIGLLEQSLIEQPDNPRLQLQLAAAYLATGDAKRSLTFLDSMNDGGLAARDRLRVIATAALQGSTNAEKELDAAISRHPTDVDLLLTAAAYHASTDRLDQARSYLQRARAIRPEDPALAIALGRLELSAGRLDEAEAVAKSTLDEAPNDSAAMILMASIAAERHNDADVDAWLNRARVARPDAVDVRMALARRASARGNTEEARSLLAEAARNVPTDASARIALAELNAGSGRYTDALNDLREAARLNPNSPAVPLATARVQLADNQVAAARASLKQALALQPGWLPAAATLTALEMSANDLRAALAVVDEVRRADPQGAASFALEGDALMAAQRPADAVRAYVTAYERTATAMLAIRIAQAKSAAKMSLPESALIDWLQRKPEDAVARRTLAEYFMSSGRTDLAIRELEKVIAALPEDAAALNNLAWLYQEKNDPRAIPTSERAYKIASNIAAVADTYGWILLQNRHTADGTRILQQAVQLAPDDPQIRYHLAYALARSEDQKQQAIEILEEITNSGKNFVSLPQARELLSTLSASKADR